MRTPERANAICQSGIVGTVRTSEQTGFEETQENLPRRCLGFHVWLSDGCEMTIDSLVPILLAHGQKAKTKRLEPAARILLRRSIMSHSGGEPDRTISTLR
jgi:hypothetical protein